MKKGLLSILMTLVFSSSFGSDTLFSHPTYPDLVYEKGEALFYNYTPRYIPKSLYHAFKILACEDSAVIQRFKERSVVDVVNKGLYYTVSRTRKQFCLDSYSEFSLSFHKYGIYYPYAMETFVLLGLHQYLNQELIDWSKNKRIALMNFKKENRVWKKRKRELFNQGKPVLKESKKKRKKSTYKEAMKNSDGWFWEYPTDEDE